MRFLIFLIWTSAGIAGIILMILSAIAISSVFLFKINDFNFNNIMFLLIFSVLFFLGGYLYYKGTHH
ncbi:hypothetical protein BBL07_26310 [Agrobacterium vitis]|nr:hypothetical protein BBL07_26310 [Agrobacterium vitis]